MDSLLEEEPFDYGFFWQCEDSESKSDGVGPCVHNTSSGAAASSTEKASHPHIVNMVALSFNIDSLVSTIRV